MRTGAFLYPWDVVGDAALFASLGADELRFYHAGLARDGDLEDVRAALREAAGSTAR